MTRYDGKATCPKHGEFKWHFIKLANGEAVWGAETDRILNCKNHEFVGDICCVNAQCPECGQVISVEVPKKD